MTCEGRCQRSVGGWTIVYSEAPLASAASSATVSVPPSRPPWKARKATGPASSDPLLDARAGEQLGDQLPVGDDRRSGTVTDDPWAGPTAARSCRRTWSGPSGRAPRRPRPGRWSRPGGRPRSPENRTRPPENASDAVHRPGGQVDGRRVREGQRGVGRRIAGARRPHRKPAVAEREPVADVAVGAAGDHLVEA